MRNYLVSVWFLVLLLATNCASITVKHADITDVVSFLQQDILSSDNLGPLSTQYLRIHNLLAQVDSDPSEVFKALDSSGDPTDHKFRLYALSEYCLYQAAKNEGTKPEVAANWYLLAALKSYDALFTDIYSDTEPYDSRFDRMRLFYARAIYGYIENFKRTSAGKFGSLISSFQGYDFNIEIGSGPNTHDPNSFSELQPAAALRFEGLTNRHRTPGVGIAYVGYRENKLERPEDKYFPKAGITRGLTAFLSFAHPVERQYQTAVRLTFYDSLGQESILLNGRNVPLTADLTAPFGYLVTKANASTSPILRALDSEAHVSSIGFYLVDAFDPNKIPLITVHGLFSSPITWANLHNDLLGDPVIRRNYQIWHFSYPTGLPVLVSAKFFREKLEELRSYYDPQHINSKLNNMVIVAHSMGGLLTHTAISDSGDALWQAAFNKPEKDVALPVSEKEELQRLLNFTADLYIKRVVFVCVPHKGSNIAINFIGKIGRMLMTPPRFIFETTKNILEVASAQLSTPVKESLSEEDPTSIKGLSPTNPFIIALSNLPIAPWVKYNSIIGNNNPSELELAKTTDGVVAYPSSHIQGAESELVVQSDHSAHVNPLSELEIRRILKEHLQESGVSF